jgi:hypothetical protein
MFSLDFGFPEFDSNLSPLAGVWLESVHCVNSKTLASKWLNTSSTNYNNKISLLNLHNLISVWVYICSGGQRYNCSVAKLCNLLLFVVTNNFIVTF